MKARIIDTGEEITIDGSVMSIFDIKGSCYYLSELTFIKDEIDWEQRRYEIAKEAMGAFIASPSYQYCVNNNYYETQHTAPNFVAKDAVEYADALIEELKKKIDRL